MKSRFTSLDIAAMVASLRPILLGSRIANVYDIGGKLFLLKFTASLSEDLDAEDEDSRGKPILLIEAGVRFHLTTFERKKSVIPSGWTMSLRKYLRGRQLEKFEQVGTDRVVLLQFGINEKAVYVIIEMYAKGNIVVTDAEWRIQLLLRSHEFDSGNVIGKNQIYPMAKSASRVEGEMPGWRSDPDIMAEIKGLDSAEKLREELDLWEKSLRRKKFHKKIILQYEIFLSKIVPFADSALILTCLARVAGEANIVEKASLLLLELLEKARNTQVGGGFILNGEFSPLKEILEAGKEFKTFSLAVDEFFSSQETAGESDRIELQRKVLESRVEKIRADQSRRIEELKKEQEILWEKANLLEMNLEIAESAISIVNALIGKQLTWEEIGDIIEDQKKTGHEIAKKISKLNFEKNFILLQVADFDKRSLEVQLRLDLNGAGNVSYYHQLRKVQREKLGKTEEQAGLAVKQAEQKLKQDLMKFQDCVDRDRHLSKVRKRLWFEKFYWFVTSENLLVIAGRDATQNEVIYKKYMKKNDFYVHADIHGAATVVVKSNVASEESGEGLSHPPPMSSLMEAGQFSLCHSSAWKSKIVTSAYWVKADQVSKTAPSGEYLSTGSFMIRGRKNFLPPTRLEMGIGVLFLISEESAAGREPERKARLLLHPEMVVNEAENNNLMTAAVVITSSGQTKVREQQQVKKKTGETGIKETAEKDETKSKKLMSRKKNNKNEKYVFNDDLQDLEIRRELMGNHAKHQVVGAKSSPPPPKLDLVEATVKSCYVCGKSDHLASDCPEKKPKKTTLHEPALDQMIADDLTLAASTSSNILDRLVANLRSNGLDEPIHALPVCGPYPALASYNLRCKIIPGSMKRGKAAKLCSQMFGSCSFENPSVKKLIKLIPVEELSECLVNDVKVTGAGVSKVQTEIKKAKKHK